MARLKAQIGDDVVQYDTETREVFAKDGRKKLGKLDNSGRLRGVSMPDPIKESDYEGAPVKVFTDNGNSLTVTRLIPDSSKTPVMVGNFAGLLDEATGNVYDPTTGRMMGRDLGGKLVVVPSFPGDNRYVGKEVRRQVPPQPSSARAIVAQGPTKGSAGGVEDSAVSAPDTAPPVLDKTTITPATPPATPAKPKFSMSRATKFSGENGYEYAFDPQTNIIAILKSPNRSQGSPPVYVRPDGKFQDAHKAIMAEYRSKMLTPIPVVKEAQPKPPPSIPEETIPKTPSSIPEETPPKPPAKKPRKSLLQRVFDSSASVIESDDI